MSKTGSNKGIYIFWGGIALVVAVVLLIIFLPRANASMPYGNMHSLSYNIAQTDKNGKNINYFTEALINDASSNLTTKTNLNNLYALQKAMANSTDFCMTGLLYLSPTGDFKGLSAKQNAVAKSLGTTLYEFQSYCTEFVTPLFDGRTFPDRSFAVNETLAVYFEKYTNLLQEMADFYLTTAQIMHTSATKCMEVNPTMLDKHLELMTTVYGFATSTMLSTTDAAKCLNDSITLYADGYYKNYI